MKSMNGKIVIVKDVEKGVTRSNLLKYSKKRSTRPDRCRAISTQMKMRPCSTERYQEAQPNMLAEALKLQRKAVWLRIRMVLAQI